VTGSILSTDGVDVSLWGRGDDDFLSQVIEDKLGISRSLGGVVELVVDEVTKDRRSLGGAPLRRGEVLVNVGGAFRRGDGLGVGVEGDEARVHPARVRSNVLDANTIDEKTVARGGAVVGARTGRGFVVGGSSLVVGLIGGGNRSLGSRGGRLLGG